MENPALTAGELRVIIALIGAVVLLLIYLFGRPRKPGQGRRTLFKRAGDTRVEPTLGDGDGSSEPNQGELDVSLRDELDRIGQTIAGERGESAAVKVPAWSPLGARPGDAPIERIVTLFVCARDGARIAGADLVVAAEKAGLQFGDMGIFHRLATGKPEQGPVFSMANMVKPGNFDMAQIGSLSTPGVSFFMALPGPLSALDAWDAMLPTAQRLAELLDAVVLDEQRNALGRQGIAHIRDELRSWDRKQEGQRFRPDW